MDILDKVDQTDLIRAIILDEHEINKISNNIEVIKILIQNGANINFRTPKKGISPLMMAASMGNEEVIKLLLCSGADWKLKDNSGRNAIIYAQFDLKTLIEYYKK